MRKKTLTKNEMEEVAVRTKEIVAAAGGQFVKRADLLSKLSQALPQFRGHLLRKGIERAEDGGLVKRVKYKGYRTDSQTRANEPTPQAHLSQKALEKDNGKEAYYYPFVAKWFEQKGKCITRFRKGKEWGMPDVSIVRASSSRLLEEIELITVEVKRDRAKIASLTQAYGYSKLAHRCYLAADEPNDLSDLKEQGERIGIGLLLIERGNPNNITELLTPPRSEPSQISLHEHLRKVFSLVRCTFCGVWFEGKHQNKKQPESGTRMLIRKRVIPGYQDLYLSVCPECENLLKLAGKHDVWR